MTGLLRASLPREDTISGGQDSIVLFPALGVGKALVRVLYASEGKLCTCRVVTIFVGV